ncbi:P-loop containing nucleoside triphosphate hydrolase protein [Xylaria nigripes]|nr:P-loop containing nucleoside triphosphate hydrolase protein [Xylaria nigripes]
MTATEQMRAASHEESVGIETAESVNDLSPSPDQTLQSQSFMAGHRRLLFNGRPSSAEPSPRCSVIASDSGNSPSDSLVTISPTCLSEDDANYSSAREFKDNTTSRLKRMAKGPDLLIAVMGMTGSGKTTFISKVTGRTDLKIGHLLTSCTKDIEVIETEIDGRVVRFVDTPGFSDTYLSDSEVLQLIADYLAAGYRKGVKLSGIIYLHPISDMRMTHHATKNLQMFRKLTGEENLKNVVLATSMWDKVTPEEGQTREQQLKTNFWRLLIAFQAKVIRYGGTAESAQSLARTLMTNKRFYVQLQREMGHDKKALKDTAAGQQLLSELVRIKEEHKKEMEEIQAMLKNSDEENKNVIDALKKHYQDSLTGLEKTLAEERHLNEQAVNTLQERVNQLEQKKRQIVCSVM